MKQNTVQQTYQENLITCLESIRNKNLYFSKEETSAVNTIPTDKWFVIKRQQKRDFYCK